MEMVKKSYRGALMWDMRTGMSPEILLECVHMIGIHSNVQLLTHTAAVLNKELVLG